MWIESLENRALLSAAPHADSFAGVALATYPGPERSSLAGATVPPIRVTLLDSNGRVVRSANGEVPVALATPAGPGSIVGKATFRSGVATLRSLRLTTAGDVAIEPEIPGIDASSTLIHVKPLPAVAMRIALASSGPIFPNVNGEMLWINFLDKFGNEATTDRLLLKIRNATPAGTVVKFFPYDDADRPLTGVVRNGKQIIGVECVGGAALEFTADGTSPEASATIYCANRKLAPIVIPPFQALNAAS